MMTYAAIAKRFKAGESIHSVSRYIFEHDRSEQFPMMQWAQKYVEHAIREVMKRQPGGPR